MIRKANFIDVPYLAKLLHAAHLRSKYADLCGINDKALHQLLTGLVAAQNQNGPGASFLVVSERLGKIVGFMAGALSRVYNIGDRLVATDIFLINDGSSHAETKRMIDAYLDWAESNPKVIEVGLSWSDTMPNGKAARRLYERRGFKQTGESFGLLIREKIVRAAA